MASKPTKKQIKEERNPEKLKKILKQKGYPNGELPKGKVAHHVKAVANGGKTTKKNIHIITEKRHKQIHSNRRKIGEI